MRLHNYLAVQGVRLARSSIWDWQGQEDGLFFILVCSSNGSYHHKDLTLRLEQGSALVMRQKDARCRLVAGKWGLGFHCFSLRTEQLFPLCDAGQLSLLEDVLGRLENPRLYPPANAEARASHKLLASMPAEGSLAQRAQVLAIAARLLSREFDQARTRKPGFLQPEEHMAQVFEELSEEEFLDLPVDDLASRFGCSRRHLTRLFHRFFGSSIADLRMELRLMKVTSLLRNPNAKIIHVAEQCGFNQLSHFNACFKRRFGMSPGQWRKNIPGKDGLTAQDTNRPAWPEMLPAAALARSAQPTPAAATTTSLVGPLKLEQKICADAPLNPASTGSLQLVESLGS